MKKNFKRTLFCISFLVLFIGLSYGQEVPSNSKSKGLDSLVFGPWRLNFLGLLTFNQYYYKNWKAGGENSLALTGIARFSSKYENGNHAWNNALNLQYAMMWKNNDNSLQKTDDILEFITDYSYKLEKTGHWNITALLNFRTQFAQAFDNGKLTSAFMAPGYLIPSVGVEYKNKDLRIFLSPLAGKATFVLHDSIKGSNFGVPDGQKANMTMGSFLNISYKKDIIPQISIATKCDVYYSYFKPIKELPKNLPDVNAELLVNFKITKYLQATLLLNLLYDYKVRFPVLDTDGNPRVDNAGVAITTDKLQFKELFGLSLTYKI